jgi:hypothetical protein
MDAIFEAYLAAQGRRRASPLTLRAVQHALNAAQSWLDAKGIRASELTLLKCEDYFDALLDRGASRSCVASSSTCARPTDVETAVSRTPFSRRSQCRSTSLAAASAAEIWVPPGRG